MDRPKDLGLGDTLLANSFVYHSRTDPGDRAFAARGRVATGRLEAKDLDLLLDGDGTATMIGLGLPRDRWLVGLSVVESRGTA